MAETLGEALIRLMYECWTPELTTEERMSASLALVQCERRLPYGLQVNMTSTTMKLVLSTQTHRPGLMLVRWVPTMPELGACNAGCGTYAFGKEELGRIGALLSAAL